MKSKKYNVLIIDDHPLITNAYKMAFNSISKKNSAILFNIYESYNCDDAYKKIKEFSFNNKNIDIVFLDISLPPSKDGNILSGEDLGVKINELMLNTKIIVSTTFSNNYRIYSIFKNLNPDGFLIKNDITPKELTTTINAIITGSAYYSKTVTNLLRSEVSNNFILDNIDRKLLYELSIGTMMKDLPNILKLSLAAIEKRKYNLKNIFNVNSAHDKELILKAREKGFI